MKKPATPLLKMPTSTNESVRVEKIANGYLSHHSKDGPKGYQTKTVFHPVKPEVAVKITPKKVKK